MKDYGKNEESSYHNYWDINNLYGQEMSQQLSLNDFKWVENVFQFSKAFIEGYNEDSDERYFLEAGV